MIAEQRVSLTVGSAATLEARLAMPDQPRGGVVVCHPHPLYGGDMDNPVVIRAIEVCADLRLATVRFNFRGVGASTGTHDGGPGEQDDIRAALAHLRAVAPSPVALAGYSFGAAMAARVGATEAGLAGLCLVAPPLAFDERALPDALDRFPGPLHVIVGTQDQYCPRAALDRLAGALPRARITAIEGAQHFFLGKLYPLGEAVAAWARALLGEL